MSSRHPFMGDPFSGHFSTRLAGTPLRGGILARGSSIPADGGGSGTNPFVNQEAAPVEASPVDNAQGQCGPMCCRIPGTESRPCFTSSGAEGECEVFWMDTSNCGSPECVQDGSGEWKHPSCQAAPDVPPDILDIPPDIECPPGEYRNDRVEGGCACLPGTTRNAQGVCDAPYHDDLCPDGSPMPADGVCPTDTCPDGSTMPTSGICPTAPAVCAEGEKLDANGMCVPILISPCPEGEELDANGVCVPIPIPPESGAAAEP